MPARSLFVTGVGGFIGKRVAERGLERGMTVHGIDRSPKAVEAARRAGIRAEVADILNADHVRSLVRGSDTVVHTAALVKEHGPIEEFRRVNVEGSCSVARAARAAGARTFIHLSSVMVYGFSYPPNVDERGPTRGEGNPYCQTKIESEQALLSVDTPDFCVTIVRPGDVYGPGSVPWISRPLEMMRKGRFFLPGGGRGVINTVYVDNLVDGIFLAIDSGAHGEAFNVADGVAVSCAEYFGRLAAIAGLSTPRSLPAPVMMGLAGLLGMLGKLGLTKEEASVDTVRYLSRPYAYCIDKARSRLGYSPRIRLEEGFELTRPFIESVVSRVPGAGALVQSKGTPA
jgi:nucleoside-diphosphate-sugar epimerase